ncbi:hypothetical protein ABEU98_26050 [Priestia megaterium]
MIADDLVHFYRYGLTFRRMLFKDMKLYIFITVVLMGSFSISVFYIDSFYTGIFILDITKEILNALFLLLGPGIWGIFLSHKSEKVFGEKFELNAKKGIFFNYKRESDFIEVLILKIYLERNNIASKGAVDELIETLKKREEIREKNSLPLYASSFALLFIPVWSATNNSIFKSMTTLKEIYIYLVVIGVCIIIFNVVVAYVKYINKNFIFSNKLALEELIHSLTALSYEYYILENNLKEDSINNSNDSRLTIKFKVIKNVLDDYYKRYPERI